MVNNAFEKHPINHSTPPRKNEIFLSEFQRIKLQVNLDDNYRKF